MTELTIIIKDEHSKIVEKELIYEAFDVTKGNLDLVNKVTILMSKFKEIAKKNSEEVPSIVIKTSTVWQ